MAAFASFALAVVNPYFLNVFWQIPDGAQVLAGHIPSSVAYAISSGPLVEQEWLFEGILAWFVRHDAYGSFVIVCALAAAAAPLLVYAAVRAFGAGDLGAGVAAFLLIGARFSASAVRAETFAVDAFALELYVLASGRRAWLIAPCVALWANVHASAVLAPVVAAVFAVATAFARGGVDARVRRAALCAVIALGATFATPFGVRLWDYAIRLAVAPNPAAAHLDVWRALSFDRAGAVAAVLPGLLVLMTCGLVLRRRYAAEIAIAALCFGLTVMHVRYEIFLGAGWAPAIARALERRSALRTVAARPLLAPAFALAPLALYAAFVAARVAHVSPDPPGPWRAAASIAEDYHLSGNAYAPYVWAAYLHMRGLPLRLLIDAHGDPYPADVWADHIALQDLHANWRDVLDRRGIGVVVLPVDAPLAQALLLDAAWRRVAVRDGIAAYARTEKGTTGRSSSATTRSS